MCQRLYCPRCSELLKKTDNNYLCRGCNSSYPVVDGIPSFADSNLTADRSDASDVESQFKKENKHFWYVSRKELILDFLKRYSPDLSKARMLEIGCGNGNVLAYLQQHGVNVEGGDIFLDTLKFCRQKASLVTLYQVDALSLPFHDEYDLIGVFDVLEHIGDDDKALAEINRALKTGGDLILTVPSHKFLWSYFDERANHKRRYNRDELVDKLEWNGFAVRKMSYSMFFLFPVLLFTRTISHFLWKRDPERDIMTSPELKTIPVINEVFRVILRLEKYLVRYMRLPFGSTLLIIAEKKGRPVVRDRDLKDRVMDLYSNVSIYQQIYAKVRLWRLDIDYYQKLLPAEGVLIDMGCGRGILENYLALGFPRSRVMGIDNDPARIEAAQKTVGKRENISFSVEDAKTWSPPPCSGVVMTDFLHHIPRKDQGLILRNVFDSLENGGVLLISEVDTSARPFYKYWASYLADILLYFSRSNFRKPEEWKKILSDIGFQVDMFKIANPFLAPMLLICRKLKDGTNYESRFL
jgi:SAM-dependent methyltransferase